jgi:hypothetical protein
MSVRRRPGVEPARRVRGAALLLLAYVGLALGAPLTHEALHGASTTAPASSFSNGCPADCHDHEHRAHDHARCLACQALARLAVRTTRAAVDPPASAPLAAVPAAETRHARRLGGPPGLRAPPDAFATLAVTV